MPWDRRLEFANVLCSQALSTADMWSVVRTYLLRLVPCRVAQPTVATKTTPSPVAVTVPSASDRKHDSLCWSLSSVPLASRNSAPPSVHRAILGPLAGSSVCSPVSVNRYKRNSGAGDSYTTAPGSLGSG